MCKYKRYIEGIPILLTILLVMVMVGLADGVNEKEIIFPEIIALAIGMLLSPKQSWQVSYKQMVGYIGSCALLGLVISRWFCLPLCMKVVVTFIICQVIYLYSRTTFAPMISAAVLPVLMGTQSIVYLIAAVTLTILTILLSRGYIYLTKKEIPIYEPLEKPVQVDLLNMLLRVFIVTIMVMLCVPFGVKFCIAPPLLVAFTEFSRPTCPARKKPIEVVGLIAVCALSGSLCRYLLSIQLGLPLVIAAFGATTCMIILLKVSKLYLPPAGALTILPMIISEKDLLIYPLLIGIGAAILMGCALLLFKEEVAGVKEIQERMS